MLYEFAWIGTSVLTATALVWSRDGYLNVVLKLGYACAAGFGWWTLFGCAP